MMQAFWWRTALLFLAVIAELSFSSLLFPESRVPGFLLNLVVALVLVRGFRPAVGEWLFLLVTYDLLRSGTITLFVPMGIFAAYAASFISRRYLFEHRGASLALLSLLAGVNALLFGFLSSGFGNVSYHFLAIVRDFFLACLTFTPLFLGVQWFEEKIENTRQAEFRGIRH